jgi:hypothetical protein
VSVRLAEASWTRLEKILGRSRSDVETVNPVAPQQRGLLYEALLHEEASRYVVQVPTVVDGRLDPTALRRAWRLVVQRHQALRAAYHWEVDAGPLQVVFRSLATPVPLVRHEPDGGRFDGWFTRYLRDQRMQAFALGTPPLVRLAMVAESAERWWLVWQYHHVALDGWSLAQLTQELWSAYRDPGADLVETCRPIDYVRFSQRQDRSRAMEYWRRTLTGLELPTPLGLPAAPRRLGAQDEPSGAATLTLPRRLGDALGEWAARDRISAATVFAAAWALVLHCRGGARDVVFGLITSGRTAPVPGIATAVGMFVNWLPLRTDVSADRRVDHWLGTVHRAMLDLLRFEHVPLADVRSAAGIRPGRALFDSTLAYQNIRTAGRGPAGTGIAAAHEDTGLPLALSVTPADRFTLTLTWQRSMVSDDAGHALLTSLGRVLESMLADPQGTVGDVVAAESTCLRESDETDASIDGDDEVPVAGAADAGAVAATVAAIWAATLGVDALDRADDFFERGGNSLIAMQVVLRIGAELGLKLTPADLFEAPTLGEFCGLVERLAQPC